MRIRDTIGSLLKAAALCACVYAVVKSGVIELEDSEVSEFAEKACSDELRSRYNATSVTVYRVSKSDKGYVVRASLALPGGKRAKAVCLNNPHGGVREVTLKQH